MIPHGAILAFENTCPTAWRTLDAANGRYLRVQEKDLPAQGGATSVVISQSNIPVLTLNTSTNNGNPNLWGLSGPHGEGKLVSFSSKDGGVSGGGTYPINSFSVGSSSPTPVIIEPSYFSVVLCEKD